MVMSDSDDTDILLLIPPTYFLTNAEEKLLYEDLKVLQRRQFTSLQELNLLESQYQQKLKRTDLKREFMAMDLAGCKNDDALVMLPPVAPYQYLPPTRKTELNHINARLHNIEREDMAYGDNPSDISSISTNTVRTQFGPIKPNRDPVGMVHSTPKYINTAFNEQLPTKKRNNQDKEDGVLLEIDNFLLDDGVQNNENCWQRQSGDYRLEQQLQQNAFSDLSEHRQTESNSLPNAMHTLPVEKSQLPSYQMSKADNNLISLSEIWGKSGQATAIATSSHSNLKEEQLRRQHLEKIIRQLQARLLEYQQRLSVAIEVDRTKDNALNNAQIENRSLTQELQQLRKTFQDFEQHRKHYDDKLETLQKELAQAVNLASKFQDKNDKLEQELSNCSRKTSEHCNQYKQKIEELEIEAHACKKSEELAINELHKLRDKYAKSEHLYEKTKLRCEEMEKENSTLRHQKDMLQEYHQKQKTRADNLDTQRKSLQESLAHLTENEFKMSDLDIDYMKCEQQNKVAINSLQRIAVDYASSNEGIEDGRITDSEDEKINNNVVVCKRTKRKHNPISNTRKENLVKRMRGQEYLGFSTDNGVSIQNSKIPARKMGISCSSSFCGKSKLRHCQKFNYETRNYIFKMFWDMTWEAKQVFVKSHVVQKATENCTVQNSKKQNSFKFTLTYNQEHLQSSLRKKLELQQKTLKSHYQQQLENVVASKLKEFQEQLDKTEETLKSEARERERLIAERAVKQLELINEKNELELNLLQEKHNEEVELYRIQLANASKNIDSMEIKLNIYKSKRADIAEKLHNVMETQWQKALEILTSPHNHTRTTHNETDHESASPDTNETHNEAVYHTQHMNQQQEFETPKSSKKENNLNLMHKQETSPMDKLQAYIELLLSKSPTDFDKLDEILALTSKAKECKDKLEKSAKRYCHSKPPWKA